MHKHTLLKLVCLLPETAGWIKFTTRCRAWLPEGFTFTLPTTTAPSRRQRGVCLCCACSFWGLCVTTQLSDEGCLVNLLILGPLQMRSEALRPHYNILLFVRLSNFGRGPAVAAAGARLAPMLAGRAAYYELWDAAPFWIKFTWLSPFTRHRLGFARDEESLAKR